MWHWSRWRNPNASEKWCQRSHLERMAEKSKWIKHHELDGWQYCQHDSLSLVALATEAKEVREQAIQGTLRRGWFSFTMDFFWGKDSNRRAIRLQNSSLFLGLFTTWLDRAEKYPGSNSAKASGAQKKGVIGLFQCLHLWFFEKEKTSIEMSSAWLLFEYVS